MTNNLQTKYRSHENQRRQTQRPDTRSRNEENYNVDTLNSVRQMYGTVSLVEKVIESLTTGGGRGELTTFNHPLQHCLPPFSTSSRPLSLPPRLVSSPSASRIQQTATVVITLNSQGCQPLRPLLSSSPPFSISPHFFILISFPLWSSADVSNYSLINKNINP